MGFYSKNEDWLRPTVNAASSLFGAAVGTNNEGAGATVGGFMSTAGDLAGMIPGPLGMGLNAGLKILGGLTNKAFGYKLNKENINRIEGNINQLTSFNSDAGNWDSFMSNLQSAPVAMNFNRADVGSDGWFNNGATRKYNSLMDQITSGINWSQRSLINNAQSINKSQAKNAELNYYIPSYKSGTSAAYGGPINMVTTRPLSPFGNRFNYGGMSALATHGADWNNGLKFINVGGSHEENPYEGVQMGVDQEGTPNLVEEGEVIWNDYVFSNRMVVPKRIKEKLKLKGMNDITYAEAAKKIQKEAEERPNDPISKRGLDATLGRLAYAQEEDRQKKQEEEQQAIMAAYGGELAIDETNEDNEYSDGGKIHIKKSKKGTFTKAATEHGMGVQEFANKVLANKDNYSSAMVKKANFAKNAAGWKHGLGGNLFWPGGPMNDIYDENGVVRWMVPTVETPIIEESNTNQILGNDGVWEYITPTLGKRTAWTPGYGITSKSSFQNNKAFEADYEGQRIYDAIQSKNKGNSTDKKGFDLSYLRYAPVIGSGINVLTDLFGLTNKPDYSNADSLMAATQNLRDVRPPSIGDYIRYTPFDRMFYLNQLNANAGATRRALTDMSGGNRGAAMAGLLASDYNTLGKIGELARQAEEYNLANRFKTAEFNRGTNQFNSEMDLKAQMANNQNASVKLDVLSKAAAIRDAIDARIGAARSANLTGLFDNLGAIGEDYINRKERDMLIRSGVFGTLSERPYGWDDKDWDTYKDLLKKYNRGNSRE